MKKRPKHRRPKPSQIITADQKNTSQNANNATTERTSKPGLKHKLASQIARGWKGFWAFAGPTVSLVGFFFLLAPQISVEPSVNLDPAQTLSTQLLIKNTGRVPIHNIHFGFALGGGSVFIGRMAFGTTLQPIATLSPGASITRAIASESFDVQAPDVTLNVTYSWPIIGKETTQSFHFAIKRGAGGFFLVPDLPR
jgi:hypothetical protein